MLSERLSGEPREAAIGLVAAGTGASAALGASGCGEDRSTDRTEPNRTATDAM